MRNACTFYATERIHIVRMDNSGNYRLVLDHPGAIDTIPISEDMAKRFKDLVEMDQEKRKGVLTEKGTAYSEVDNR